MEQVYSNFATNILELYYLGEFPLRVCLFDYSGETFITLVLVVMVHTLVF